MKIRVKNKYLILFSLFLLLSFGFVHLWGGEILLSLANNANRSNKAVKALAYYDAFLDRYPDHARVPEAFLASARLLSWHQEEFSAVFFPQTSQVSRVTSGDSGGLQNVLGARERYLRIVEEFPGFSDLDIVYFNLAELECERDLKVAEHFYLKVLHDQDSMLRAEAALGLMDLYVNLGRFADGKEVAALAREHFPYFLAANIQISLGDLYVAQGDYQGARRAYEKMLDKDDPSFSKFWTEEAKDRLEQLPQVGQVEFVQVAGTITLHGKPLAGVKVFAVQGHDPHTGLNVTSRSKSRLDQVGLTIWISDQQGKFTGSLPEGDYQFGIELNYPQAEMVEGTHLQIINGELSLLGVEKSPEVKFSFVEPLKLKSPKAGEVYQGEPIFVEWEAYPDAAWYSLQFSGLMEEEAGYSSLSIPFDSLVTTETSFLLDDQEFSLFGFMSYDLKGIDPICLQRKLSGFDLIEVTVTALDGGGKKIISSDALYFVDRGEDGTGTGLLVVERDEANQVRDLLKERRDLAAVDLLEKRLKNDPTNVDDLYNLATLYFYRATGPVDLGFDGFNLEKVERSLECLEQIKQIQPSEEVEWAISLVLRTLEENKGN